MLKKINIRYILSIIKDILTKTCIYFAVLIFGVTLIAAPFNRNLNPVTCFMFALASLGAGIAVQVFKIKQIPVVSRHIAFCILLYLDFILIVIPSSGYNPQRSDATLLLSVCFIVIYFIIFGIIMGIKAIINAVRNKNLKYEEQFKNAK